MKNGVVFIHQAQKSRILEGSENPHDILRISGRKELAAYLVDEIQPDAVRCDQPGVVELRGAGFDSGLPIVVRVGGLEASDVTWLDAGRVSFVPPPGVPGALAEVTYEQAGLLVEARMPLQYEGPVVLDVHPRRGPLAGGTELSILGRHFHGAPEDVTVILEYSPTSDPFECVVLEVLPPDRLRVRTPEDLEDPPIQVDPADVIVTTSAGAGLKPNGFLYAEDVWVDVASASIEGGEIVTVQGEIPPPPSGGHRPLSRAISCASTCVPSP